MIVFVLRHADRTSGDDLSLRGQKRAQLLARMLGESGVSIAFRSDAVRAKLTLDPLKTALGSKLQVEEVPIVDPNDPTDHIKSVINSIRSFTDDRVVIVVGHTNTVGPIVQGLGGNPGSNIGENEFDRMFILCIRRVLETQSVQIRFGDPTPCF